MKLKLTIACVLIVALLLNGNEIKAQDMDLKFRINAQPFVGFPVGTLKETQKVGFGGHLSYERLVTGQFRWMIQFGGGAYAGKEYTSSAGYPDEYDMLFLAQLRAGGKYYPGNGRAFVAGYAGGALTRTNRLHAFGYSIAPMVGYALGINRHYDVAVSYDYSKSKLFTAGAFCISLGYHFPAI